MYTETFYKLNGDSQVLFMLVLSELIEKGIADSEDYELATKAMNDCWQWLEKKDISGDDLYDQVEYLDDNDVESGILFILGEEKDPVKQGIWGCIGVAVSYTALKAYDYDKEKYRPTAIQNLMEDTIDYFFNKFILVYKDDKVIFDLFKTLDETKTKYILETKEIVKRQFLL